MKTELDTFQSGSTSASPSIKASTKRPSPPNAYLSLLSSLATDLDLMLNDLCASPNPRFNPSRLRLLRNDHLLGGDSHSVAGSETGGEDDLQALLPASRDRKPLGRDNLSHSRYSLSSDGGDRGSRGGSGAEAEGETSDSDGESSAPCGLGLVERLLRSHPVWFLPGIQRAGAVHLLQGKEEGNFVVRGSSQVDTMAVSVRLPPDRGPYIEHYLVQSKAGRLGLETSTNRFDSIPELIAHYAQCCDELPVQLTLPRALREAPNRQQLSSLALLGQEFWRYPMANPRPPQNVAQSPPGGQATPLAGTPSDTTSSLSSFTSNGNQMLSPESSSSIVLSLSPVEPSVNARIAMSTFKGQPANISPPSVQPCPRAPRPTPPNTLDLVCKTTPAVTNGGKFESFTASTVRTPPAPPPRWSKPLTTPIATPMSIASVGSPSERTETTPIVDSDTPANFTVTTTVTFSVEPKLQQHNGGEIPTLSKRLSPEGECVSGTLSSHDSVKDFPIACPRQVILSPTNHCTRVRRTGKRKESRHYQESDILDSPNVYCRSHLGDKASDYEDIWGPDHSTLGARTGPHANRPEGILLNKRPDLLPESSPSVTSLNGNLLSPASSTHSNSPPGSHPVPNSRNRLGLTLNTSPPGRQTPIPVVSPSAPGLTHPNNHHINSSQTRIDSMSQQDAKTENVTSLASTPVTSLQARPSKQGSPFYAEPADSIAVIRRVGLKGLGQRHSEPSTHRDSPFQHSRIPALQRIDSSEELGPVCSGSVDNLRRKKSRNHRLDPWPVDSSWEFMGNGDADGDYDSDWVRGKFPPLGHQENSPRLTGPRLTVHQIIARRLPDLNLTSDPAFPVPPFLDASRMSSYDNVEGRLGLALSSRESDDGTVFSEPWDSSRWETLLPADPTSVQFSRCTRPTTSRTDDELIGENTAAPQKLATISRSKSCRDRLDPMLSSPGVPFDSLHPPAFLLGPSAHQGGIGGPGAQIRAYALHLAADKSTTFAQNIDNFIACTRESREVVPQVVMRNMRQFMSGMKNYLVKHGEREFEREVERARVLLSSNEFLNLDSILEAVMHRLVVLPLREHLYALFVDHYERSGDIQLLADNIKYALGKTPVEIGIRASVIPPNEVAMKVISEHLQRLQEADSPLDKLEHLLAAIATIYESTTGTRYLSADDFLPLLILVISRCGMVGAEIEAELMWGLLQPSLLSGEAGYYLTALSSAVHVLKSFRGYHQTGAPGVDADGDMGTGSLDWRLNSLPAGASGSVLRVVVPDEHQGSLQTRTLPVRPHTTAREVCRIIAHKARITNPQDYGLFKLVDGEETLLADGDCPQDAGNTSRGKHCVLAYKRIDAKIAWPRAALVAHP